MMAEEDDFNASFYNHPIYYEDDWDPFDYYRGRLPVPVFYLLQIAAPILIFGGVFANVLALVVVARGRLWLKHEGYIYLAASFCANIGVLLICSSSQWLRSISHRYYPPNTSNFICKSWYFFTSIFFASGWLSLALQFNVYLREHLIHRRCCGCPMFAAKYCTLFATKIIVGVIFGAVTIVALPYLAFVYLDYDYGCTATESYQHAFRVEMCLMWILPMIIYMVVTLAILCTSREGRAFGFSQVEERSVSDEQVRVIAVVLSSMVFLSQFVLFVPYHVAELYHSPTYATIAQLVYAFAIDLQPVLCFVVLKALREEFRSQLRRIRCCRRLCPSLDRDEDVVQLTAILEDPPGTEEC